MTTLLLGIVLLLVILMALPNPNRFVMKERCRGHAWEWVKQPDVYGEDGNEIEYLWCSKCKRTAQEIMSEKE